MRSLSGPTVAVLNASVLSVIQLVRMDFPSATIALNSSNRDVVFAGVTYRGASGLGEVSPVEDSPGEIKGIQFAMSGVSSESIALALADSPIVQGTPTEIRLAIISAAGAVLDAPLDFSGRLDTMSIEENGDTCTIAVTAESNAVDLLRGVSLTTSNADQQFLFPGDRAFEYVNPQSGQSIVWPTKQYYIDSR